ncbi:MAG: putative nucleotidyltransferase [Parcubacteria group bacterium GW2011_GWA2_49_9]|nr:MAG: putative nucleotidyltransferase [Parcubacteria group bacterium GW2011_GWA2_49_9]
MIDEEQRRQIGEIAKKHKLSLVVLFGSQATGRVHTKSDIDIAVLSLKAESLSKAAEDIGDVFKRNDVEVADLSVPSPYLWHAVAKEGVLLFEASEGLFSNWKLRAMNLWYDTVPLRARQKAALRSWANAQ